MGSIPGTGSTVQICSDWLGTRQAITEQMNNIWIDIDNVNKRFSLKLCDSQIDKDLQKAGGHKGQNVVIINTQIKIISWTVINY